jgi:hypothetical protein
MFDHEAEFRKNVLEQFTQINQKLDRILTLQGIEEKQIMLLDDQITALTADVTAATTVTGSAVTLIQGFAAQLAAAVAAAQAAGATPTQLASLTSLGTSITQETSALAAAVTANTPAAPTS